MEHQHDAVDYWSIAQEFLFRNGKMGDGSPMTATLTNALMLGVWVGARFTLFDHDFGMGLAHRGNMMTDDPRFKALRDGFDKDFEAAVRGIIEESMLHKGFTHMQVDNLRKTITNDDTAAAIDEILNMFGDMRDA